MRKHKLLFAAMVLLLAGGWTDCDFFSTVTVPSRDNTDPTVYAGIHKGLDGWEVLVDDGGIMYDATPGEDFFIVSAGMDAGGMKKVKIFYSWRMQCCVPFLGCPVRGGEDEDIQTQAGAVGRRVSNGIYAAFLINVPACPEDAYSGAYDLTWNTVAEDFHGNVTWGASNTVEWRLDRAQ